MIRLKDIAREAGVSTMTVSKALRDAPDVSPATKNRVRLLARQMGYLPDSLAQGLRGRQTKLLGLTISATTNPIFARVVMAIEERAFELGYELVFAHSLNLPEREETIIRRFLGRRVDGLLLSPVYRLEPAASIYEELRQRNTPTVLLGPRASFCPDFCNVETDDLTASYTLTSHLLSLEHRQIAFLAGPPAAPWAVERLEGYTRAFRDAGLEPDDNLLFKAGATIEDGENAILQLLNETQSPTAIQAVNDLAAIGAANVLLNRGWRIPQDISVAGFGNIMASEYFRVPLTTIRQPTYRLGIAAMEALTQLLQNQPATPKRLPGELVIRDSTGPVR